MSPLQMSINRNHIFDMFLLLYKYYQLALQIQKEAELQKQRIAIENIQMHILQSHKTNKQTKKNLNHFLHFQKKSVYILQTNQNSLGYGNVQKKDHFLA